MTTGTAGAAVLAACLAFATLDAGCDQGCPPNTTDSFSLEPVDITLLDAVTGASVCGAEITANAPCSQCALGRQFQSFASGDASCSYQLSVGGSGPMTVSITASGFEPKTVAVNVAGYSCGNVGGLTTMATIRISPE